MRSPSYHVLSAGTEKLRSNRPELKGDRYGHVHPSAPHRAYGHRFEDRIRQAAERSRRRMLRWVLRNRERTIAASSFVAFQSHMVARQVHRRRFSQKDRMTRSQCGSLRYAVRCVQLHGRSDAVDRKLSVSQLFGLCLLARCRSENCVKDALTDDLGCLHTFDNRARIDIHIF